MLKRSQVFLVVVVGAAVSACPAVAADRSSTGAHAAAQPPDAVITAQAQRRQPSGRGSVFSGAGMQPMNGMTGTDASNPFGDAAAGQPDVLLQVPNLSIDSLKLDVNNVNVRLALQAQALNLLQLNAGATVDIQRVHLEIDKVQAQALLRVQLQNVAHMVDSTMNTLDRHPELVTQLLGTVNNAVNTVGGVANTLLQPNGVLSQTVNNLGQTVNRVVDSAGNILEQTLDNTGKVANSRTVGSVLNLPVISQTTNAAGQVVRQVRDNSGRVIQYTLDQAGHATGAQILGQGSTAPTTGGNR